MTGSEEAALESGPGKSADSNKPPSLWANADYRGWWTGNTVSALGTSISAIAYPLLVLFATGSVAKAGLITAANLIGTLATTLWGGALADRISRKAILVFGPLVQAAVLAVVALIADTKHAQVPYLAAAALLSGLCAGLIAGATTPALRRIVPKDQLPTATAQAMGRDLAAELLGTPVGGFLFAVSRWFPFAADAVSFLFASLGAMAIRRPLGPDRDGREEGSTLLQDVKAGIGFVRGQPFLRFVVIWGAVLNTLLQAFTLLFIALVRYRGGGPTAVGVVSAVALVGGVLGAVLGPAVARQVRARYVMYGAAWAFVGTTALVSVVPKPWEIGAVTLLAMLTMVPLNVVLESYVVRIVPDAFSGRVAAVTRFGTQALHWTGPLLAGLLAAVFGVPGGTLALLILLVPTALALHLTGALALLDRPLEEVGELSVPDGDQDEVQAQDEAMLEERVDGANASV
ncbi:MAG TPA: MFS transporter [Actinocrinis sp.]|nr:MFS transporter [Actinocrinis sp.]